MTVEIMPTGRCKALVLPSYRSARGATTDRKGRAICQAHARKLSIHSHFRLSPKSGGAADMAPGPKSAISDILHREKQRAFSKNPGGARGRSIQHQCPEC
jgi:hypothetical protein